MTLTDFAAGGQAAGVHVVVGSFVQAGTAHNGQSGAVVNEKDALQIGDPLSERFGSGCELVALSNVLGVRCFGIFGV